jgi:hypothetical protein
MPATSSIEVLVDTVLAELVAHLPTALTSLSAPAPATEDFYFGDRELRPTTRTPRIEVAAGSLTQHGGFGAEMKRDTDVTVIAIISSPNEDLVHRYLARYVDAIISVLESEIVITGLGGSQLPLIVQSADLSFSFGMGNALYQAASVEARLVNKVRTRGDL